MTVEEGNQRKKIMWKEAMWAQNYDDQSLAIALAYLPLSSLPSETESNYLTDITIQI